MKKSARLAVFFLVVSFLPFLRSCGDVSIGFPAVALSGRWILGVEALNIKGLVINISVMCVLCLLFIKLLQWKVPGKVVTAGMRGIVIYHLLILSGYCITHPLFVFFYNRLTEYAVGIHFYVLYPFSDIFEFSSLQDLSAGMSIYGDIYDIKFRIHYLSMTFLWFCGGSLTAYVRFRVSLISQSGKGAGH